MASVRTHGPARSHTKGTLNDPRLAEDATLDGEYSGLALAQRPHHLEAVDRETLVVTRIDRLARSMRDLQVIVATLKDKGAHLAATEQPVDTSTAADKALGNRLQCCRSRTKSMFTLVRDIREPGQAFWWCHSLTSWL